MPPRTISQFVLLVIAVIVGAGAGLQPAKAVDVPGAAASQSLYDRAAASLVAVKFTIAGETSQKDLIVSGVVVDDQGLVMIPLVAVSEEIPTEQLQHFQIIVPHQDRDDEEINAEFQGRDERCNMAFVKAKPPENGGAKHTWIPVHFESVAVNVGDNIASIGLQSKSSGYQSIFMPSIVSANLRDPMKTIRVTTSLAGPQSPVFNSQGQAIGVVAYELPAELNLDDETGVPQKGIPITKMFAAVANSRHFIPTAEFLHGLQSPPTPAHPVPLAWTGLPQRLLSGLSKNDAAFFKIEGQPAIQINDILPDSPAQKAGLKKKDIIVKYEGEPLERGNRAEDLPAVLGHKLIQRKPGDVVTFTVISGKDQQTHDVKVTLEPQPKLENAAQRYWSDDIGFGVREMVLLDRYQLKLKKAGQDGVLVTVLKDGGSAISAGLRSNDMITQINGQPVTNLDGFKSIYEPFRHDHAQDAIVLVVHRGSGDETIRIEPPQ